MSKKLSPPLIFSIAAVMSAALVMLIAFRSEDPKKLPITDESPTQQRPSNPPAISSGASSQSAISTPLPVTAGQAASPAPSEVPQSSSVSIAGKAKMMPDQQMTANNPPAAQAVPVGQSYQNNAVTYSANTGQLVQPSNAPATSESASSNSLSTVPEQEIAVPPGAIAPAALYDDEPKTPQQEAALERILNEFQEGVSEDAGQGLSQTEIWEAARLQADRRYLTLFGWQAYNARHLQSAKEAVHEKRALASPN